jgi:hypothetical protein
MFKQGDPNGHSQYDDQNPCPPLRLPILGFVALAMQEPLPLTLSIGTSIAVNPVKLTYQPIHGTAVNLFKRTSTNWA